MVKQCCIRECRSECYPGCGVSFFKFPRDSEKKKRWLDVIPPGKATIANYSVICSRHFRRNDLNPNLWHPTLVSNAVPSIFSWTKSPEKEKTTAKIADNPEKVLNSITVSKNLFPKKSPEIVVATPRILRSGNGSQKMLVLSPKGYTTTEPPPSDDEHEENNFLVLGPHRKLSTDTSNPVDVPKKIPAEKNVKKKNDSLCKSSPSTTSILKPNTIPKVLRPNNVPKKPIFTLSNIRRGLKVQLKPNAIPCITVPAAKEKVKCTPLSSLVQSGSEVSIENMINISVTRNRQLEISPLLGLKKPTDKEHDVDMSPPSSPNESTEHNFKLHMSPMPSPSHQDQDDEEEQNFPEELVPTGDLDRSSSNPVVNPREPMEQDLNSDEEYLSSTQEPPEQDTLEGNPLLRPREHKEQDLHKNVYKYVPIKSSPRPQIRRLRREKQCACKYEVERLRREVKVLRQRLRRRESKIASLQGQVTLESSNVKEDVETLIRRVAFCRRHHKYQMEDLFYCMGTPTEVDNEVII